MLLVAIEYRNTVDEVEIVDVKRINKYILHHSKKSNFYVVTVTRTFITTDCFNDIISAHQSVVGI